GNTGAVKSHVSSPTYPNDFYDYVSLYDTLVAQASRVEEGDFIFTRTRHLGNKTGVVEVPDSVKTIFRDLHSVAIDTLTYRDLWIMFARKGFPAETREWVESPGTVNEILRDTTLVFSFGRGSTQSPPVGPAQAWASFGWERQFDTGSSSIVADVLSADEEAALVTGVTTDGDTDLSFIDPFSHSAIALQAAFVDSTNSGTPQLTNWYVEYTPVAELALDPLQSGLSADTLQEGRGLSISSTIENLSDEVAGLSRVEYYLTTSTNERRFLDADTLSNLDGRVSVSKDFSVDTRGLTGDNSLEVRLSQPGLVEPISFNNVLVWPFRVLRDTEAPTLDVLIDGEIFPPDPDPVVNLQDPALPFVPLNPVIEIVINDENEFLPLGQDTTIVRVRLDGREIPASELTFSPPKRQGDRATIQFSPELPSTDTTHTVIVEAFDITGNAAPDNPYQVHFRTQTFLEVEDAYPYPNPMSSSTVFAFRLRGADTFSLDDFRLRIYTINGQLIREFDLIEDPSSLESG
ncbi:MAG: hypothetical protein R3178_11215, partial [Rhodothermales bacterium]|nr:hypothetical protein [Rhodothermales bacterium]